MADGNQHARTDRTSVGADIGYIVGVAVVLVTIANVGVSAGVAQAMHGLKAGVPQYVQFGQVYLATFALSLSVTAGITAYAIPRVYGVDMHWGVAPAILVAGALLTAATDPAVHVRIPTNFHWVFPHNRYEFAGVAVLLAMLIFAQVYPVVFLGGVIVGAAGGLVLAAFVQHHAATRSPAPPASRPWAGGSCGLIALFSGMAILVLVLVPQARPAIGGTPSPAASINSAPAETGLSIRQLCEGGSPQAADLRDRLAHHS